MTLSDITRRGFLIGAASAGFGAAAASPAGLVQELMTISPPAVADVRNAYRWVVEHIYRNYHDGSGFFPGQVIQNVSMISDYLEHQGKHNELPQILADIEKLGDDWQQIEWFSPVEDMISELLSHVGRSAPAFGEKGLWETNFAMKFGEYELAKLRSAEAIKTFTETFEETPSPMADMIAEEEQSILSITQQSFSNVSAIVEKIEEIADAKEEPQEAPAPVPEERHLTL